MLKVAVMVSGGGTNLQAIIDAVESGRITNTELTAVISNNKSAYALDTFLHYHRLLQKNRTCICTLVYKMYGSSCYLNTPYGAGRVDFVTSGD